MIRHGRLLYINGVMVFCLQNDALDSNVTTYLGDGTELQTEFSFTEVICLKIYVTLSWNESQYVFLESPGDKLFIPIVLFLTTGF